jgi:hypothetical protein
MKKEVFVLFIVICLFFKAFGQTNNLKENNIIKNNNINKLQLQEINTVAPQNISPVLTVTDVELENHPVIPVSTSGKPNIDGIKGSEIFIEKNSNHNLGKTGPGDNVTITPANLTINSCSWPSNYFTLGNILISEALVSDFAIGANVTLVFSAPANFEFQPGVGTVGLAVGDLLNSSIVVTNTTITVTYTCGNVIFNDVMTLGGINVRALAPSGAVTVTRTGGSGVVAGLGIGTVLSTLNSNFIAGGNTTWNGATSNDWTVGTNWSAGVPAMCIDVTIPAGMPRYPILTAAQVITCRNLTIDAGASLTNTIVNAGGSLNINGNLLVNGTFTNNTTQVYNLYGNLTINGTYNKSTPTVYDNLRGSSATITFGPAVVLSNISFLLGSGSTYTLASNANAITRFWTLYGSTFNLSSFTLRTQFFINQGTTSLNTGILEITDLYSAGIGPDGFNPYFGGTMNVNTGTVMYSPRAGITGEQRVKHNLTYYNLTLNGRNGTTILISDDVPSHSCVNVTNNFRIINNTGTDMTTGRIATNLNIRGNFTIGGNCDIGSALASENNAVILELNRPIRKSASGTGFTMFDNPNHQINVLWGSPDSTMIYNYGSNLVFYGTVLYDNPGTQLIPGNSYNNVTINSGGQRYMTANTTINNNLLINGGVFSASAANYNVTIKGDWTNKGSFDCRTASVFFNDKPIPTANLINGKAGTSGFVLREDFEGGAPGWSLIPAGPYPGGGTGWYLFGLSSYSGLRSIAVWDGGLGPYDAWTWLFSPKFNCNGQTNAWLTFYNTQINLEQQVLFVTNNASAPTPTWVQIADYGNGTYAWTKRFYDLGTYVALTNDMQLQWAGFHHLFGSYSLIDSVTVWVKPPSAMDDFYNLTMNRSLGVTVDNSINVKNTLDMTKGNFRFSSPIDYLEIGYNTANRGSLSYTSGIVVGRVKRWFTTLPNSGLATGMFPFGTATNFCPAQIEFTGAPITGGSLMGRFITTLPGDYYSGLPLWDGGQKIDNLADEGLWQLDAADGLAGGIYTCKLIGTNFVTVTIPNNVRLLKRPSIGGPWTADGTHWLATNPPLTVERRNMSGFSQFALGGLYSENNILPISLLRFDLNCNNDQVKITWATASESNNDYFTIERSADGKNYNKVSDIKAAGNSNSIKSYLYIDKYDMNGTVYYRLKQTNYDGNYTYIAAKFTNCSSIQSDPQLVLYPNPFNDLITFDFKNLMDESLIIIICDVLGNQVLDKKIGNITGNNASFTFDLSQLAKGVYYYKVYSGDSIKTGKIVKE